MIEQKYLDWITDWNAKNDAYRKCYEATREMQQAFPELQRIEGYVETAGCRTYFDNPHWWLVNDNGDIIDPTARQFECVIKYIPFYMIDEVPHGYCMHCGECCTSKNDPTHRNLCSDACYELFRVSLMKY